jgi:hypothetical protein
MDKRHAAASCTVMFPYDTLASYSFNRQDLVIYNQPNVRKRRILVADPKSDSVMFAMIKERCIAVVPDQILLYR